MRGVLLVWIYQMTISLLICASFIRLAARIGVAAYSYKFVGQQDNLGTFLMRGR